MQIRGFGRLSAVAGVATARRFTIVPAQRRANHAIPIKGAPERDPVAIIWTHRKVAIAQAGYHGCTLSPGEVFSKGLRPMDDDPACMGLADGPEQRLLEVLIDHAYGEDGGFENAARQGRMFCHSTPFVPTAKVFSATLEFTDPYYHPKDSREPAMRVVYQIDMAAIVKSKGRVYCLNSEVAAPYRWETEVVVLGAVAPQFIVRAFIMKKNDFDWEVDSEIANPNYRTGPTSGPAPAPSTPATTCAGA
ncbi:hypothetical protein [Caenimonas sp. SL110]|uniref:hypothetical protein n=1 Tax=Caenimonas sp. SL110 TaxID=1450524 RepID=UPI000652F639|nr:hypothetical protein [Caenimonas sp. SL110]